MYKILFPFFIYSLVVKYLCISQVGLFIAFGDINLSFHSIPDFRFPRIYILQI
jgi:hypothetical protein